jgi:hypothetical protein
MSVPMISSGFGDLVDRRVTKLFYERYDELPDVVPVLFNMDSSSDQYETVSQVGNLGDFTQFTGQVEYQDQSQGYDATATHIEFASGIQIERALYDDDRHGIWERRPTQLAEAANRTRQGHAARVFVNAGSVDTFFYRNTENVALVSDSHTTTSGASTAAGFDNKATTAFSAAALLAAVIQMKGFRDDRGNRISIMPDEIWIPVDLYGTAFEVLESFGKTGGSNNERNVHYGGYKIMPSEGGWNYMSDATDWFLCDSKLRKQSLTWYERVALEFAQAEDIDTLVAKWRAYMRYSYMHNDWRWVLGSIVAG